MNEEIIRRAGEIIGKNTAKNAPEGAEPYCVLALMDDGCGLTASAITAANAEGIAWIAFCTGLQSNKAKRIAKCDRPHRCGDEQDLLDSLAGGDRIEDQRPALDRFRRAQKYLRIGRIQHDAALRMLQRKRHQMPQPRPPAGPEPVPGGGGSGGGAVDLRRR